MNDREHFLNESQEIKRLLTKCYIYLSELAELREQVLDVRNFPMFQSHSKGLVNFSSQQSGQSLEASVMSQLFEQQ